MDEDGLPASGVNIVLPTLCLQLCKRLLLECALQLVQGRALVAHNCELAIGADAVPHEPPRERDAEAAVLADRHAVVHDDLDKLGAIQGVEDELRRPAGAYLVPTCALPPMAAIGLPQTTNAVPGNEWIDRVAEAFKLPRTESVRRLFWAFAMTQEKGRQAAAAVLAAAQAGSIFLPRLQPDVEALGFKPDLLQYVDQQLLEKGAPVPLPSLRALLVVHVLRFTVHAQGQAVHGGCHARRADP